MSLKTLNKETVTFVLMNDFNFSDQLVDEIVETIWRSDERLEEIQQANTASTRLGGAVEKNDNGEQPPSG